MDLKEVRPKAVRHILHANVFFPLVCSECCENLHADHPSHAVPS
jgi:hypothetical protein